MTNIFSSTRLEPGTRLALRVEYDGRAFNGWQTQKGSDVSTVQETLELALRPHCKYAR
jgi:tRNA U38,U39,U40 pseudouridine synthase TruA